jgi:hypothetical protein
VVAVARRLGNDRSDRAPPRWTGLPLGVSPRHAPLRAIEANKGENGTLLSLAARPEPHTGPGPRRLRLRLEGGWKRGQRVKLARLDMVVSEPEVGSGPLRRVEAYLEEWSHLPEPGGRRLQRPEGGPL